MLLKLLGTFKFIFSAGVSVVIAFCVGSLRNENPVKNLRFRQFLLNVQLLCGYHIKEN